MRSQDKFRNPEASKSLVTSQSRGIRLPVFRTSISGITSASQLQTFREQTFPSERLTPRRVARKLFRVSIVYYRSCCNQRPFPGKIKDRSRQNRQRRLEESGDSFPQKEVSCKIPTSPCCHWLFPRRKFRNFDTLLHLNSSMDKSETVRMNRSPGQRLFLVTPVRKTHQSDFGTVFCTAQTAWSFHNRG